MTTHKTNRTSRSATRRFVVESLEIRTMFGGPNGPDGGCWCYGSSTPTPTAPYVPPTPVYVMYPGGSPHGPSPRDIVFAG